MDKKTKLAWLKRYSETNAVSGFEAPMKELISGFEAPMKELMQERLAGKAEVSYDKLGSVVFTSAAADENAPKIMLASHMDASWAAWCLPAPQLMKTHQKLCWQAIWTKSALWLNILPKKAF